jgi:hypothetical protein
MVRELGFGSKDWVEVDYTHNARKIYHFFVRRSSDPVFRVEFSNFGSIKFRSLAHDSFVLSPLECIVEHKFQELRLRGAIALSESCDRGKLKRIGKIFLN